MKSEKRKIAFVGGGNMAEGLIKGLLDASLFDAGDVFVSDTRAERLKELQTRYHVKTFLKNREAVREAHIILVAVKPQVIDEVLDEIGDLCNGGKLVISIAAGVTLSAIRKRLPEDARVIRVMPNTPAMVGEGMSALCSASPDKSDIGSAAAIFRAVGKTVMVEEKMLDAVTGLSGSGPAFIFLIIEALSDAGVKMSLPRDIASLLAAQTVRGAAAMVLESGKHVGELKDMVTSPGGTTIAGLHALEKGCVRSTIINAVEAATRRSRELATKEE